MRLEDSKYNHFVHHNIAPSTSKYCINVGTATQLELVQPLVPSAGPTCCLLGVLGPTYTVGGIRALRAAILQPSCKKEFIEARLDAVQELIENDSGIMSGLQDTIKKLSEIDKILLLCIETNQQMDKHGEAQLNQTLLLKTTMDMVPNLVDALKPAESGRLRKIKMDFENPHYNEIAERIRGVLLDDAHLEKGAMGSLQRCFAVKPEINGLLDVARRTYSELIEDIQKIVEQLSETYDLPIRLNQNVMKGFHIVLPVAPKNRRDFNVNDLPAIFIQVHFNGSSVTMTTEELVVLDHQAKEALNEIQKMSNIVISALLKDLRPFMPSLYKLCENVAELDILIALAQISTVGSYIRPDFNDYMDIRNSVHPLLDYNSQVMPIPNDVFASPEYNFTIITGPNMGGKSIYIKQIAIMQVMAQMKEIQHILKGLTRCSLVIIDELCRGTSVEEGTTIAWAICEELIASEAFTFFTTHFMYLTRLEDLYFNVVNRHTAVAEEDTENSEKRLIYQHKIESGISKIDNYGLALAAKTNLPEETVNLAKELAQLIATRKKPQHYLTDNGCDDRTVYGINAKIAQEKRQNPNINLESAVKKFASENTELVERLRIQSSTDKTILNTRNTSEGSRVINSDSISGKNEERAQYDKNVMNSSISNNNEEIVIDKNMNPTSVKFSTELLNTFLNTTDAPDAKNDHICKSPVGRTNENADNLETEIELHYSNVLRVSNKSMNFDDDDKVSENQQDSSKIIIIGNNLNLNDDILESQSNMNYNTEFSNKESETDSDLAEALTQRIEECSLNSKQSSEILSSDEELMEETINEITNEIQFEYLVLTPPPAFRDIM
ncbi:mutS protein homolog 4-like [Colias croceus]|uniref:mutS protein homolog 4-like n=1 Tax=Colias crocea TaxID=72248 RepID=UPI001E27CEBD|nr:mutS protein homolog 4-like [Colias croceus]